MKAHHIIALLGISVCSYAATEIISYKIETASTQEPAEWKLPAQPDVQKNLVSATYAANDGEMPPGVDEPASETQTPNDINEVEISHPASEVRTIDTPVANNMGTAALSFPVKIPAARNGMGPEFAVLYNSEGGNGLLGLDWSLHTPSVTLDTRWGVPRYNASTETETYMLNNQQLSPVAHRAEAIARTAEKRFYQRIEDEFQKIIRHNNSPASYWWEVTDKDGTRRFYGGTPAGGLDQSAVLTDANGNIAHWALTEARDANDNFVKYRYTRVSDGGNTGGSLGHNLYLSSITYSGHGNTEGKYSVEFTRDRQLGEQKRSDVIVSARLGFKQVTADLLRKISIKYNGQNIRSYELNYTQGAFFKTLLQSVSEFDVAGVLFNTHSFEYYNDVESGQLELAANWTPQSDDVKGTFLNPIPLFNDKASSLSGNKSLGGGFGIAITIGPYDGNLALKTNTAGVVFGFNYSRNEGMLAMVDINGDGLADKVFKKDGQLYFRANQSGPGGTQTFGPVKNINGISDFNKGETFIGDIGLESHFGIFAGFEYARTEDITSVYFADVNGDLLIDIVRDGRVYFNHIDGNGNPTFTTSSGDTPSPINAGSGIDPNLVENDPQALDSAIDVHPLHDVVKVWRAPYDGTVSVTGAAALVQDNSPDAQSYTAADGVRVAIQHKSNELWFADIPANDFTSKTPSGVGAIAVQKGDKIYFRVQSKFNGAYDQVSWSPQVTYSIHTASLHDANNLPVYQFKSDNDFLLSGPLSTGMSIGGTVKITGNFTKPVTSDDLTIQILKKSGITFTTVLQQTLTSTQATTVPISIDLAVLKNDALYFNVISNTNVDWAALQWKPFVYFTTSTEPGITQLFNSNNQPLLYVYPTVDFQSFNKTIKPSLAWEATATGPLMVRAKPDLNASFQSGELVFTVKKQNQLLAKQFITITNGIVPIIPVIQVPVDSGDKLFFEYHVKSEDLANTIDTPYAVVAGQNTIAGLYTVDNSFLFGPMYRHWGQFAYNGNRARASQPIIETDLKLDESLTDQTPPSIDLSGAQDIDDMQNMYGAGGGNQPKDDKFIYLVPNNEYSFWVGYDNFTYVKKNIISSSRMGKDDILPVNPIGDASPGSGSGAVGIKKVATTDNFTIAASAYGAGGNVSFGWTNFLYDFTDLNGDQYPDILSSSKIQYTKPYGGLEPTANNFSFGEVEKTEHFALGLTLGGTFLRSNGPNSKSAPKGAKAARSGDEAEMSAGISANFNFNKDSTAYAWMDINGDGLADRVHRNGNVELNLGYSFLPAEQWGFTGITEGTAISYGAGLSINISAHSISAGIGMSRSENETNRTLQDMNGDGLLDYIFGINPLRVAINTGSGFAAPVNWGGANAILQGVSTGESLNGAFTIGFPIIPLVPVVKLCINPSFNVSQGANRTRLMFDDVDGDGFPDLLQSEEDNNLTVSKSTIKRTNKLKKVIRPLGAYFTLDYKRVGNTYNMPTHIWALASVDVYDGVAGDGADRMRSTFEYEDGVFNRHEREFYGFRKVTTLHHDTENSDVVYRKEEVEYVNDNFYEQGLMRAEVVKDAAGNKFAECIYSYELKNILTGATLPNSIKQSDDGTAFPALITKQQLFYEGAAVAGKTTSNTYAYDPLGNISSSTDLGDPGTADDLITAFTYHSVPAKYIMNIPASIIISSNGQILRQRETTINNANGNITEQRKFLENGDVAKTNMEYDVFGNVTKITRPQNATGQRLAYNYEYDAEVRTFKTKVSDSYGYSRSITYDVRFGKTLSETDINNQQTIFTLDNVGRITTVRGPFEIASGQPFTISYEYHPQAAVPWALMKQYDPSNAGNLLESAVFCDGLKRIIQLKKDGALFTGANSADEEVMIVSGEMKYDAFGRIVAGYHPVTEAKGTTGVLNNDIDVIAPTRTTYDVINRPLVITQPDNVTTTAEYSFGADRNGDIQFKTKTTDANGISTERFYNVRTLLKAVKRQYSQGTDVWSSYDYNAVNEMLVVTDDHGNKTISAYDRMGRRISVNHPDAGLTTYRYDLNSKFTHIIPANLQGGTGIRYSYDHERVTKITYPQNTQNNVEFTYGAAGATFFRAGRMIKIQDAGGTRELFYDALGAIVKEKKIITVPGAQPLTYNTEWTYDTWNRLTGMIYPDGETLTYTYNQGGLLKSMLGIKAGTTYNYLPQTGYDKFEVKIYGRYGNGTETTLEYADEHRHLHKLTAKTSAGRVFMDNHYDYDDVDNIVRITNDAPVPPSNLMGGKSDYQYTYDDLYRLTNVAGKFLGSSHEHRYSFEMKYDNLFNITYKKQVHERKGYAELEWAIRNQTTYEYNYNYNPNGKPHASVHIGERAFSYDANGNQTGWLHDVSAQNRQMTWDEENRIKTLNDNGETFNYAYDFYGHRVWKSVGLGQTVSINGKKTAETGSIGNYVVYVNPYMVVRSGGFTKHFYVNDGKIVSKLGESGNGSGTGGTGGGNGNNQESFQFYYHSDHLGNTAYVTDKQGEVYQHLEYFPSGETFIHEHGNQERTPYLYNGKELDEETALYYYGARYYDTRTSSWQSVDPSWELPDEIDKSPYIYVLNNPVFYNDPDGRSKHIVKGEIGVGGEHRQTKKRSLRWQVESDHIPPYDAMQRGGIHVGRDDMPAVTVPYAFHRAIVTTGSSYTSRDFRDEQADLISQGNMYEAIRINLDDYERVADEQNVDEDDRETIVEGLNDLIDTHVFKGYLKKAEGKKLKAYAASAMKKKAKKAKH